MVPRHPSWEPLSWKLTKVNFNELTFTRRQKDNPSEKFVEKSVAILTTSFEKDLQRFKQSLDLLQLIYYYNNSNSTLIPGVSFLQPFGAKL